MKLLEKLLKIPDFEAISKLPKEEQDIAFKKIDESSNFWRSAANAICFGAIALNVLEIIKSLKTNDIGQLFISMLFIYILSLQWTIAKLTRDHREHEHESFMNTMEYIMKAEKYINKLENEVLEYEERKKDYENTGRSN